MCKFLTNLFKNKKSSAILEEVQPMKKYLIVGLGNIGDKYHETRHNIGFKILDYFANKEGLTFETQKLRRCYYL